MAQFEVFANTNPKTRKSIPYLLDVQADLLHSLATRVVVPLIAASAMGKAASRLNPEFEVMGTTVVMSTAQLAGVSAKVLGDRICSLSQFRVEIIAALDFLFTGF
jgi:toxin CcdB